MIFRPFYRPETGCASYVFGCPTFGEGVVVDPLEGHLDEYLAAAAAAEVKIAHVIETHVHADHRSGGRELAGRTGARYRLHRQAQVEFPFDPLEDGELIDVGNTKILVLHTPGHTPEGVCLLVSDHRRGPEPWFLLTGDTLFVGAVGRPDIPGNERDNAGQLYDSLHTKILPLPDEIEIYPAHFLGSACGSGMSGKPTSTLGFERRLDPLLSLDREAFVAAMAADIPPKPADMASVLAFNCGREAARA